MVFTVNTKADEGNVASSPDFEAEHQQNERDGAENYQPKISTALTTQV